MSIISVLKLLMITFLVFVFDVYVRNYLAPLFLWGFGAAFPLVPLDFFWLYILGAVIFHIIVFYFRIRQFIIKFLVACVIYLSGNLPFVLNEHDFLKEEAPLMMISALMVALLICLLHLAFFRKSLHNVDV